MVWIMLDHVPKGVWLPKLSPKTCPGVGRNLVGSQILCGLAQSNFKGPVDADLLQGLATKTELKMLREKVVASEE